MSKIITFTGFATSTLAAECPEILSRNGLYYSATGSVEQAIKLELPNSPGVDRSRSLSLSGNIVQPYHPNGRFYLKSSASEPWFNLRSDNDTIAVLVRRETRSIEEVSPDYISIFRSKLDEGVCNARGAQGGLASDRNFLAQGEYVDYHLKPRAQQKRSTIRSQFHFYYDAGGLRCSRTDEGAEVETVFNGTGSLDVRTAGGSAIEQTVSVAGSILIGQPVYADTGQQHRLRVEAEDAMVHVSSIEATLFHTQTNEDICLEWPAPIPTTRAGGVFADLFKLTALHETAAERLAADGEWSPKISVLNIFKVSENQAAGHIRLYWR
ncbi:MAG: hypothetical protein AAFN94_07175 [Pseudomonadota bacterium]